MLHTFPDGVNKETITEVCQELDDLREENEQLHATVARLETELRDAELDSMFREVLCDFFVENAIMSKEPRVAAV